MPGVINDFQAVLLLAEFRHAFDEGAGVRMLGISQDIPPSGPVSTIRPRKMTATRSAKSETKPEVVRDEQNGHVAALFELLEQIHDLLSEW